MLVVRDNLDRQQRPQCRAGHPRNRRRVPFGIGWIAGWPARPSLKDFTLWVASGLICGALIGLGAYLFALMQPYAERTDFKLSLPIIFGILWVLMSQLIAEMIFVGLVSYELDSDSDREWLGRAAGWTGTIAIARALTAFLSVGIGNSHIRISFIMISAVTSPRSEAFSSIATAILGVSGKTSATTDDNHQSWTTFVFNLLLSIAGPVFVAALIVGVSIAARLLMFGDTLHALHAPSPTRPTVANETLESGITAFLREETYQKHCCSLDWPRKALRDTKYCILFRAYMAITVDTVLQSRSSAQTSRAQGRSVSGRVKARKNGPSQTCIPPNPPSTGQKSRP